MNPQSVESAMSAMAYRSWYASTIADFINSPPEAVLGTLVANAEFDVVLAQRDAWRGQIHSLQAELRGQEGSIHLEFKIPRMGRRIDAVLLIRSIVFVVEFKVGETRILRADLDQAWDYALDLKNFHRASHDAPIVPILIPSELPLDQQIGLERDSDNVYRPIAVNAGQLGDVLAHAIAIIRGSSLDHGGWARSPYQPTPTIVEAARTLYAQHSVEDIARFDAGATNLAVTSLRIEALIEDAIAKKRKAIIFVTGVPGAGKTLVGLNVATQRRPEVNDVAPAVYLSGNGPLVAVLREALTRDEVSRRRAKGEKVRKGVVGKSVEAFIQNVHHFRDEYVADSASPPEHVVIFDEAQRAWNLRQTAGFMLRKKRLSGFSQSEPEFLISCMDRHKEWAVIVCLVGSGQEINTGEAGIAAWIDAVAEKFPDWDLYLSDNMRDSEFSAATSLARIADRRSTYFDDSLHLAVSLRSFRAEHVSRFVKTALECELEAARTALATVLPRYPIVITRDLLAAKRWIRAQARGSERYGMVASSKAYRLKPHAIDVRTEIDPIHWFLNERDDIRSSYFLEDAATEFQVQGLELDWTCVTWDGDLRYTGTDWSYHDFRGDRWTNISKEENRQYLRNAYRVLLTRARQGMAVFVPPGDSSDATRQPVFYDRTFHYLKGLGIPSLDG